MSSQRLTTCRFAVSFSLPYLLYEPYAALGSRVGFIFGSVAALSLVFVYFSVPDCSGRTLEEIDRLFESGVSLRKFKETQLEDDSSAKSEDYERVEQRVGYKAEV